MCPGEAGHFQPIRLSVLLTSLIILSLPVDAIVAYACHSRN